MDGLDLLGAADAFSGQYITFRIKSIDRDRLRDALGGKVGAIASGALSVVDSSPKAVLDIASPLIKNEAKNYGVDTDIIVSNVPPTKGGPRALSEFWPGIIAGTILGASGLLIYKGIQRLLERKK